MGLNLITIDYLSFLLTERMQYCSYSTGNKPDNMLSIIIPPTLVFGFCLCHLLLLLFIGTLWGQSVQSGSPNIELGGGGGLNLKWLPGGTRD